MNKLDFNRGLLDFLDASPSAFHASANLAGLLDDAGFKRLLEAQSWSIDAPGRYYVVRDDSSVIAFSTGASAPHESGFHMIGAHTDSPCLKLKPNAAVKAHGYWQLGVEVYGGVLLNPWFDRDLSLAGRVILRRDDGQLSTALLDFEKAIAVIPSLAIHLDREANEGRKINKQTYLPPLVCLAHEDQEFNLEVEILAQLAKQGIDVSDASVAASELAFYPVEKAAMVGLRDEFIASARLDNLLSCYLSVRAIIDHDGPGNTLIVCNDHEEVGSGSAVGARGPFLRSVLERLSGSSAEDFGRMIANSLLVSSDNAHGIHPNFADRHDNQHAPMLNAGPAIKVNSNQAYASTSATIARFKNACRDAEVLVQSFVTRTDLGCGSTIGPLTATALGVATVDVGVPTFAMHSIRELAGSDDAHALYRAVLALFASELPG